METLYKRNAAGNPIEWRIYPTLGGHIGVEYGVVGHSPRVETFAPTMKNIVDEIKSRINQKRKEGYKKISELHDNAPDEIPIASHLYDYLNTYLPYVNTTGDGTELCMLAKVFQYDKLFKNTDFLGQYKINGLRCTIRATKENSNIFMPYRFKFYSREGKEWKLEYLEEYLMNIISSDFLEAMIDGDLAIDGELYLPGYKVNDINHFVKDRTCPEHKLLQFWCYDIAVENMIQSKRIELLIDNFGKFILPDATKEVHLNNKNNFVLLPTRPIADDDYAILFRDLAIEIGFEGAIFRDANKEYQFGKRNAAMWKFKKLLDGKFKILDIIPEGTRRENLPKFICKNDINDETFECKIKGDFTTQEYYLTNKDKFIGLYLHVEYRERSGIKEVPFHGIGLKVTI